MSHMRFPERASRQSKCALSVSMKTRVRQTPTPRLWCAGASAVPFALLGACPERSEGAGLPACQDHGEPDRAESDDPNEPKRRNQADGPQGPKAPDEHNRRDGLRAEGNRSVAALEACPGRERRSAVADRRYKGADWRSQSAATKATSL